MNSLCGGALFKVDDIRRTSLHSDRNILQHAPKRLTFLSDAVCRLCSPSGVKPISTRDERLTTNNDRENPTLAQSTNPEPCQGHIIQYFVSRSYHLRRLATFEFCCYALACKRKTTKGRFLQIFCPFLSAPWLSRKTSHSGDRLDPLLGLPNSQAP